MRASEPAVINERSRRPRTPLESNASCHALEEHDSAPPLSRAMKKSERLRAFVDQLPKTAAQADLDSRYTGYFACFNSAQYYEAHHQVPSSLEEAGIPERLGDGTGLSVDTKSMSLVIETQHGDVVLTPQVDEAGRIVQWSCSGGEGMKPAHLPQACRGAEPTASRE